MSEKRNTDIFGNEYTIAPNGERITHYKSLWTGEDIGVGSDGKEYRTHTDVFGNQVTTDSNGVEYTTHENFFGQLETYGNDGSGYVTNENIFGVTETIQTHAPREEKKGSSYNISAEYNNSVNFFPNADPFAGLSKEQIHKIYADVYAREDKLKRDAAKKLTVGHVYYWLSFVFCFVLAILSIRCYDRFVPALASVEKIIPWIPLIIYILAYFVGRGNIFHSIYVGNWVNQVVATVSCEMIMMTDGYDRYMMREFKFWFWIPFAVTFWLSFFTFKQAVFSDPDVKLSSVLKNGARRYIIDAFIILGMICGWVTAIAIRTPFSGRLKVPFIIALITLLACSLYCYYCYTKDRRQIISEFKRQAEQKAEQEKELQTSPEYNVFIMVEDVHDERIDGNIFAKYKVERIKNKARLAAQNMKKPVDSETLDILKAGRAATAEFRFNGWILEKYLCREKTYKNNAMESLMEIYCNDYYYVLEKNGELKVYNIYINIDNLDNEPYGNVSGFYIKKHDLSYTSASSVSNAIESCSALALDCQIPYQREPRIVGDEIRVFNRYYDEIGQKRAGRLPEYKDNGDGIIDRLDKLISASTVAEMQETSKNYTATEKAYSALGFSSLPGNKKALNDRYIEQTKLYHPQYGEKPDKATYLEVKSAYEFLIENYFKD